MATIQKRGDSYRITVSCGYDSTGKQVRKTHTWIPTPNMTAKQIEKELERQKVLFEDRCKNGFVVDGNIKFSEFVDKWFNDYAEKQLKAKTIVFYKGLSGRVNDAIGHIKIDKIMPHHLISLYNNLSEKGIREDSKYTPTEKFKKVFKKTELTQKEFSENAGVSLQTVKSCLSGNNVSKTSADKMSAALNDCTIFSPAESKKTLSATTIAHHHRFISSVLSTAVEWQVIPNNPCNRVKPPKGERKESRYLDEVQTTQLIECLQSEPIQYRTIINLLLYSGMRRGELCGLEWDDVDFDNNVININKSNLYIPKKGIYTDTTKNKNSDRIIKIPLNVMELLSEYKQHQLNQKLIMGSNWNHTQKIFATEEGNPIHPDTITSWFSKFVKRHQLPTISVHSLRHTSATLLIASGMDIRTVAKRLGHATPTTTGNIYSHAIKSADEIASDMLGNLLNPTARYKSE